MSYLSMILNIVVNAVNQNISSKSTHRFGLICHPPTPFLLPLLLLLKPRWDSM